MQDKLLHAIKLNMLVHAYLFIGEKSKNLDEAKDLAMAVNCLSEGSLRPCGDCLACRKIRHGNHPDVMIIEPKGSSLKIEQVRELQKSVNFKHFEGRCKVVVLTGADFLTVEAANSLLKILEEPPENTIFILTAENGDNILPTVISRCQVIKLAAKERENLHETDDDQCLDKVRELLNCISDMDYDQVLSFSESAAKNKDSVRVILAVLLTCLRDTAVAKISREALLAYYPRFFTEALESPVSPSAALKGVTEVQNSQRQIEQNANVRLVLDVLLLRLQKLIRLEERYGEGSRCQV